jgi:ATP-dependent DNA helicase RecG
MTETELKKIIAQDEALTVEFKLESEKQQALAEVLGAMANSIGGWLLVGVNDSGKIVGVTRPKMIIDRLYSAAATIEPPLHGRIKVESIDTKDGMVVAAYVPEGLLAIHSVAGVYRLRIGSYNKILTFDQAQALAYRRGILHYEQSPIQTLRLEDLRQAGIESYMERRLSDYEGGSYANMSRFEILRNLGCAVEENGKQLPNVAAALFFSGTPDLFVPSAQIIAARFAGTNSDRVLDRITVRGTLPQIIDTTARFVEKNIRYRVQLPDTVGESMAAQDVPEYPIAAYREMIVNMVAHRDYYNIVPAHLMIFDDRIVAENPGGLLPGLSLKTLENRHRPRNPRIVEMLHTMSYVERFGSGIGRMRRAMEEANLPDPIFEADENYFRVTLQNSAFSVQESSTVQSFPTRKKTSAPPELAEISLHEKALLQKMPLVRLKQRQKEVLRYLIRNGKINNTTYREISGLSVDATLNDLRELLDLKLIKKIGTTGRAVYYILNPNLDKE